MTKDTTTDRAALHRAATLVRPALAGKAYIPALMHILFDGLWATAYDDKMAIAVRCSANLRRLVPGELLVQSLASFGGKEILFTQDGDDALVMKSGRSKVKLPTMPQEAFPFKWPEAGRDEIEVTADMLRAVERCLISVNRDASHPAQMGVTVDVDADGRAVFFSTDNNAVSRAQCKAKVKLPGDAPVILPSAFCEQLVGLSKAFPVPPFLFLMGDAILVEWEDDGKVAARLFSRIPVDLEPMDFPRIITKHCGDVAGIKKRLTLIPEGFDQAVGRALLVLGGEAIKKATVKVDDGTLKLHARSDMGDADDSLKFDADDVGPVNLDAALVARGLKGAALMGITDVVTILSDADAEFVHMVAHVREV